MKPAYEPIILARKPGPMRELGIEECRVAHNEECRPMKDQPNYGKFYGQGGRHGETTELKPSGRWPANLVLECTCDETREGTAHTSTPPNLSVGAGSGYRFGPRVPTGYSGPDGKEPVRIHTDPNCPCAMLDGQTGTKKSGYMAPDTERSSRSMYGQGNGTPTETGTYGDSGGASRFFYCPKASRSERNKGLGASDGVPDAHNLSSNACAVCGLQVQSNGSGKKCECGDERVTVKLPRQPNHHPTVKPLALMRWLVKLVARPGDVVLDPFMGSGTTGVACVMEGREFIGIEREAEYIEIARRRIEHVGAQGRLKV